MKNEPIRNRDEEFERDAGSGSSAGSGKEQPSQGGNLNSNAKLATIIAGTMIAIIVIAYVVSKIL